jgi:hypothetical protein
MDSGPRTPALPDTGTGRVPGRNYSRLADIASATSIGSVHGTGELIRHRHTRALPGGCVMSPSQVAGPGRRTPMCVV